MFLCITHFCIQCGSIDLTTIMGKQGLHTIRQIVNINTASVGIAYDGIGALVSSDNDISSPIGGVEEIEISCIANIVSCWSPEWSSRTNGHP